MASKTLLSPNGIASLRRFFQNDLANLRQSPILLISSKEAEASSSLDENGGRYSNRLKESCQLVQFTMAQQLGLRVVNASISSAFPSLHDMKTNSELLQRTGAKTVVGVGSGAAMDLAKAMPHNKHDKVENLLLIPSTYSAILASSASHSLFLDPVEETLVPIPKFVKYTESNATATADATAIPTTTIAILDEKYIAPLQSHEILFASLAIILDACYRQSKNPLVPELVQKVNVMLDDNINNFAAAAVLSHDEALDLMYQVGQILSYGLDREDRSIPIALAASLIPPLFPHEHPMTFFASLLPGICQILQENNNNNNINDPEVTRLLERLQVILDDHHQNEHTHNIPRLAVLDKGMQGFSIPDISVSHISSNQTVWNSWDVSQKVFSQVLHHVRVVQKSD